MQCVSLKSLKCCVYKRTYHLWRPPVVPSEWELAWVSCLVLLAGDLLLVISRCTVPWILNIFILKDYINIKNVNFKEANLGNPFYTSLRKGDSHLKHISLTYTIPWLTPTRALSPSHTRAWPPCGSLPSATCFCAQTRHYPVPPSSYWLTLFSSQTFPPYKYSNIFKPSHPSYLSAYENGTDRVFRNVGV
jgi:hypothetical protein